MAQQRDPAVFYDEEECLGFGVFVAELELIVGSSRDKKPDQIQLLELLQKLAASIASADGSVLKQHQKRCEAALYNVVYKGPSAVACHLAAVCLSRLYTAGDLLPLFSRINSLQTFLQDKSNTASEGVRLCVMDVLAHLNSSLGRYLATTTVESMAIATKALAKGSSPAMKMAGLRLTACVVEGLPNLDRNTPAVQAAAWKLLDKQAKDKTSDELRGAAAGVLAAICWSGGAFFWSSAGYYAEEALRLAVAVVEDAAAAQATREAYALALADLAAAAQPSNIALATALEAETKPAKKQQLEKVAGSIFKAALVQPLLDAAVQGNKDVCMAMSLAWSSYAYSLTGPGGQPDSQALVALALKAVDMLEIASKATAEAMPKGQSPHDAHNIGACLSGGEMPVPTAAVIYFIRAHIIQRLPEQGQRHLLAALARATSHAIAPPVIVAALEGCGVLLEQLGELHDEVAIKAVEDAAMSKLSASSTAVRHQAAAVVAALALSSPPLLARLFGECLEGVETFCQQLMLLAAPYNKARVSAAAGASTGGSGMGGPPGTPRGAPDSQTKHCIDGLHGNALAVGALLVASARSAVGAPSRLTRSVFWIAKRMISQPYCSSPWAVAAEREAGYMLLGCMCAAAAPGLLAGRRRQQQILELFSVALGPAAAEAVTGTTAAGDADTEQAVSCWWRAAALQALSAYVLGIMGKGMAEDAGQQVRLIAAMLLPLLEAITSVPHLADPTAAAAATPSSGGGALPAATPPSLTANGNSITGSGSSTSSIGRGGLVGAVSGVPGASGPSVSAASGVSSAASFAASAESYSSPVAAASVALLQLRLYEVFYFLPAPHLWSNCHSLLLQLCCRQLLGRAGSTVQSEAAASIASSSLRHMLSSQDVLLGPWLPGRDMYEDELRSFAGERGGPQQHPWEVGAAFTTGFITYSQALLPPDDNQAAAAATAAATAAAAAANAASHGGSIPPLAVGSANGALGAQFGFLTGGAGAPGLAAAAVGSTSSSNGVVSPLLGQQHQQQQQHRQAVDGVRISRRFMPYPQPYSLGPALLEAQMWLLGKLLAVVNTATQLQVLEVMLSAVSTKSFAAAIGTAAGRSVAARHRAANCTAVALAVLASVGPLSKRLRADAGDKVAEKLLQLASCMLEDQVFDTCLARAGAEIMAAAACIGSTGLAVSQVKAIVAQLAGMMAEAAGPGRPTSPAPEDSSSSGSSPELRAVLCLVLGSIHRARGGLALQPTVAITVATLVSVASRPAGAAHMWALHGLWLVACASGPGYAAHVKQTLQLALELLVSSFGEHPLLQPAAARLANAVVAVLGPEFTLGSAAYSRCKTLVTGSTRSSIGAGAAVAGGSDGSGTPAAGQVVAGTAVGDSLRNLAATCAELEQVLFAQQLILFAPGAVPAAKHLPLLLLTLISSRPALRRAAAATLRHLADRDPRGLTQACIEPALLAALDAESESSTSTQIRGTLTVLLIDSAPRRPGYWLRLLGSVALAAGPAAATAAGQQPSAGSPQPQGYLVDDDEETSVTAAAAVPSFPAAVQPSGNMPAVAGSSGTTPAALSAAAAAAAAAAAMRRLPTTPRLQTRMFAAELLLLLFSGVGPDQRHRHPKPKHIDEGGEKGGAVSTGIDKAQAGVSVLGVSQDFLVDHLQSLIDLGYKLTTGSAGSLRPAGAQLLQLILHFFGTVADPDVPELLLLEQYQAQFVAALRAALAPGVAPALAVCGGTLATSFLSAGLAAGDGAVMRRLMDLLVAPLEAWQGLLYEGFAEAVGVRARVALLQAHAQCANLVSAFNVDTSSSSSSSYGGYAAIIGGVFGSDNNDLCRSIVIKAQAPHKDMLLLLWWGVLLDYAAFCSTLPGLLDNHKSLLFGNTHSETVEAVQASYAAAWPSVLMALASHLPTPAQLAAAAGSLQGTGTDGKPVSGSQEQQQQQQEDDEKKRLAAWTAFVDFVSSGQGWSRGSSGSSSNAVGKGQSNLFSKQLQLQGKAMHAMLINVCLMLLCESATACAAALASSTDDSSASAATGNSVQPGAAAAGDSGVKVGLTGVPQAVIGPAQKVAVCLQALQLVLSRQHFATGLATAAACADAAKRLTAVAVELLMPWQRVNLLRYRQSQQQQQGEAASGFKSLGRTSSGGSAAAGHGMLRTVSNAAQNGTDAIAASTTAVDSVFGLVVLATADVLLALADGLPANEDSGEQQRRRQQPDSIQQRGITLTAADASQTAAEASLLAALLALSSVAVPFEAYEDVNAVSSSRGTGSIRQHQRQGSKVYLPPLPVLEQPAQQQQANGDAASYYKNSLSSATSTAAMIAALSSLCQAARRMLQQSTKLSAAFSSLTSLGLRLLLTAHPGPQLAASLQLLDSCWQVAAAKSIPAASQQGHVAADMMQAVATACNTLCVAVRGAARQICSCDGSSGVAQHDSIGRYLQHFVLDAPARLPALLSALISAAACCCCGSSHGSSNAAAASAANAVQDCCGVLLWALKQGCNFKQHHQQQQQGRTNCSNGVLVASAVLEVVRQLLQDTAAAAAGQQQQQPQWRAGKALLKQQLTAAVLPQVAVLIHAAMSSGVGPLTGVALAAVTEGLKVLLLLSNQAAAQGDEAQLAVMMVLVPLLVEVARPPKGTPVTPLLRDMACKLVSAMPASAAAGAFTTAVMSLPVSSKQRLQLALKEQASAAPAATATAVPGPPGIRTAAAGAAPAASGGKKPAIELKMNFAMPAK